MENLKLLLGNDVNTLINVPLFSNSYWFSFFMFLLEHLSLALCPSVDVASDRNYLTHLGRKFEHLIP